MRGISGLIGLAVLALGISSCGGGGDGGITPPPGGGGGGGGGGLCAANTVCMGQQTFFPATLTVAPGTSVDFTNGSGATHNVVFDNTTAVADIPPHTSGTTARTFSTAGTYNFHCDFHAPGMTGKIVVQ
jgi:plastocyanin